MRSALFLIMLFLASATVVLGDTRDDLTSSANRSKDLGQLVLDPEFRLGYFEVLQQVYGPEDFTQEKFNELMTKVRGSLTGTARGFRHLWELTHALMLKDSNSKLRRWALEELLLEPIRMELALQSVVQEARRADAYVNQLVALKILGTTAASVAARSPEVLDVLTELGRLENPLLQAYVRSAQARIETEIRPNASESAHEMTRFDALEILRERLGPVGANELSVYLNALSQPTFRVARAGSDGVRDILGRLAVEAVPEPNRVWQTLKQVLGTSKDPYVRIRVEALLEEWEPKFTTRALTDPDPRIRAALLEVPPSKEVVEKISRTDPDLHIRARAREVLAGLDPTFTPLGRWLSALQRARTSRANALRDRDLEALTPEERAMADIVRKLRDPSVEVRKAASDLLARLGRIPGGFATFLAETARTDKSPIVRSDLIKSMGALENAPSVGIDILLDSNSDLALEIIHRIAESRGSEIDPAHALKILKFVGKSRLAVARKIRHAVYQAAFGRGPGYLTDADHVEVLKAALKEKDAETRQAAARKLSEAQVRSKDVIEGLWQVYLSAEDPIVMEFAKIPLARFARARDPVLLAVMKSSFDLSTENQLRTFQYISQNYRKMSQEFEFLRPILKFQGNDPRLGREVFQAGVVQGFLDPSDPSYQDLLWNSVLIPEAESEVKTALKKSVGLQGPEVAQFLFHAIGHNNYEVRMLAFEQAKTRLKSEVGFLEEVRRVYERTEAGPALALARSWTTFLLFETRSALTKDILFLWPEILKLVQRNHAAADKVLNGVFVLKESQLYIDALFSALLSAERPISAHAAEELRARLTVDSTFLGTLRKFFMTTTPVGRERIAKILIEARATVTEDIRFAWNEIRELIRMSPEAAIKAIHGGFIPKDHPLYIEILVYAVASPGEVRGQALKEIEAELVAGKPEFLKELRRVYQASQNNPAMGYARSLVAAMFLKTRPTLTEDIRFAWPEILEALHNFGSGAEKIFSGEFISRKSPLYDEAIQAGLKSRSAAGLQVASKAQVRRKWGWTPRTLLDALESKDEAERTAAWDEAQAGVRSNPRGFHARMRPLFVRSRTKKDFKPWIRNLAKVTLDWDRALSPENSYLLPVFRELLESGTDANFGIFRRTFVPENSAEYPSILKSALNSKVIETRH